VEEEGRLAATRCMSPLRARKTGCGSRTSNRAATGL